MLFVRSPKQIFRWLSWLYFCRTLLSAVKQEAAVVVLCHVEAGSVCSVMTEKLNFRAFLDIESIGSAKTRKSLHLSCFDARQIPRSSPPTFQMPMTNLIQLVIPSFPLITATTLLPTRDSQAHVVYSHIHHRSQLEPNVATSNFLSFTKAHALEVHFALCSWTRRELVR